MPVIKQFINMILEKSNNLRIHGP